MSRRATRKVPKPWRKCAGTHTHTHPTHQPQEVLRMLILAVLGCPTSFFSGFGIFGVKRVGWSTRRLVLPPVWLRQLFRRHLVVQKVCMGFAWGIPGQVGGVKMPVRPTPANLPAAHSASTGTRTSDAPEMPMVKEQSRQKGGGGAAQHRACTAHHRSTWTCPHYRGEVLKVDSEVEL